MLTSVFMKTSSTFEDSIRLKFSSLPKTSWAKAFYCYQGSLRSHLMVALEQLVGLICLVRMRWQKGLSLALHHFLGFFVKDEDSDFLCDKIMKIWLTNTACFSKITPANDSSTKGRGGIQLKWIAPSDVAHWGDKTWLKNDINS